jgi:hypothetical protein
MKNLLKFVLLVAFVASSHFSFATNPISEEYTDGTGLTVEQFLDLKYADLQKMSAQKLSFNDRLSFYATKRYVKAQLHNKKISKADELAEAADGFNFKFGAFLIGFLFGIFGLLGIWIFVRKPRKNAMVSCLIGLLLWGVILGALA